MFGEIFRETMVQIGIDINSAEQAKRVFLCIRDDQSRIPSMMLEALNLDQQIEVQSSG